MSTGLLFISPWLVGFVLLTLYPAVNAVYYSFCDYDILNEPVWIGGKNYRDLFSDALFLKALWNTTVFILFSLPLGLLLSLCIAMLLNRKVKGRSAFRTLFFMPSIVPAIAVGMIWLWVFNGEYGLLNYGLSLVGVTGPNWLADPAWTKPAIVLTTVWQCGGTVVIYLAALQDVPRHLYEAAELDGASALRRVWHVTIPTISPVIYFNLVMGIISSLQVFAGPYVMLGASGGPDRSALFYAVYLFQCAFRYNRMGYAAAMAWMLFGLILILTMLATRVSRRYVHTA